MLARRGRNLDGRSPPLRRDDPHPRRLSRPPVHRRRLRRRDRTGGAAGPRQGIVYSSRRPRHLHRPADTVPGGPLSLPRRRPDGPASGATRHGHGRGRRDHGDRAQPPPRDRPPVSSGIGAHRTRLRPARPVPPPRRDAGGGPPRPRRRRAGSVSGAGLRPPARGAGPVIIESILTTRDALGTANFAPMGVEWGEREIVIKPFVETTTFRNLRDTGAAVVNLTDDVMLFARGAISTARFPTVLATVVRGVVLEAACSWREVEVRSLDATPPRARVVTAVVHQGFRREFLGFNRARHAVLDLGGDRGRRFGGMGAGVHAPSLLLEARSAPELGAEGPDAPRALEFARRFAAHHGIDARLHFCLHRTIPAHAGLGSGTQLALAVARATAELYGLPQEVTALARAVDRGRRSAVGTWTFAFGGFVLEGGRRTSDDGPAPLLTRLPIPAGWRCVVVVPEGESGRAGDEEAAAFARLPPPDGREVERVAHLVLMQLLPAVAVADLRAFGAALTEVQRITGGAGGA